MNIEEILEKEIKKLKENNIKDPKMKAKVLLSSILNVKKEYLIINSKEKLEENKIIKFKNKIDKLIEGIPLQYLTNMQEFMGLEFYVDENVLIPQPDTEILVEEAIKQAKEKKYNNMKIENIKILDLCTGSGCIAISLAKYIENSNIIAIDISENALEIAHKNAIKNNVEEKIKFNKSNMFENISETFNIIVSNPPYIETGTIKKLDKEVQQEPHIALNGGKEGLDFYKIIANQAYKYLEQEGTLIIEIGYNQKEKVIKILKETQKYKNIECKKDYSNNNRIIICNIK